ncbi:hypothetical protein J5N97_020957 [Dioscorea zingiberensis]|uniref:Uncharacterized protein n=1 Tax=Dioscorea zingiberensis TaxID=325984 RepID=A0A9D5CI71_9LILI|nr:hypothetical protein J5N97_020957 [Dioscorea zingiberensis]
MENSSESALPFPVPDPISSSSSSSKTKKKKKRAQKQRALAPAAPEGDEWRWRRGGEVKLEGYVEVAEGTDGGSEAGNGKVGRTKSLTDEDLEELKGCLDLGFGFSYDEIPELCSTLPALELCYSMSQRFLDEQQQQQQQQQGKSVEASGEAVACSSAHSAHSVPIANWKISSPGDNPDEVKARLKYWAQAVACTVRLCS